MRLLFRVPSAAVSRCLPFGSTRGLSSSHKPLSDASKVLYLHGAPQQSSIEVFPNFITPSEHDSLCTELDPLLAGKKYESGHWDGVISSFRELEKANWSPENTKILQRVKDMFSPDTRWLYGVHVLDLHQKGRIDPHVDSIKFSGDIIAGLSLLSDAVMHLTSDLHPGRIDLLLPRYSLYIMREQIRYDWKHAIASGTEAVKFGDIDVRRGRRISLMFRDQVKGTSSSTDSFQAAAAPAKPSRY